jgi:N-acetylmuramic acid 6-phosphate etherase
MIDLKNLATEQSNAKTKNIDDGHHPGTGSDHERRGPQSSGRDPDKILPQVAAAIDVTASHLHRGGRLFYVGCGTSGRLGILDAAECPPYV